MAMTNKTGTAYETGVFEITGMVAQSATKAAGGELKVYRDEDGDVAAVYAVDADDADVTFEGLVSAETSKSVGDTITVDSKTYRVKSWDIVYQNDEVTKVRGTAHLYEDVD